MRCPVCNEPIDELTEICPNCKINLDDVEEEITTEENEESSKTIFLKVINIIQLVGLIIGAIVCWVNEITFAGFVCIIIGVVTFAFIKGFTDIIDLLDSINKKL